MQPARYGGYEYGFTAFIDVISELARGCTSSAWGCSLGAIHQWLVGTFPEEAQDDVWREDPSAIVCGSYAPATMAQKADGGYLVQGKWLFASNVDNSQWALLGVQFPPEDKGAPPSAGFLLAPRADWRIEDNWHVAGQAGTGSKAIVIDQPLFIPGHRKLSFAEASSNQPPGARVNTNPIYRIPFLSAVPVCLTSPLLGTAQGAVDALIELAGVRVTRGAVAGGGSRLSEFFPVQSRLAEASASVDAARLLIYPTPRRSSRWPWTARPSTSPGASATGATTPSPRASRAMPWRPSSPAWAARAWRWTSPSSACGATRTRSPATSA